MLVTYYVTRVLSSRVHSHHTYLPTYRLTDRLTYMRWRPLCESTASFFFSFPCGRFYFPGQTWYRRDQRLLVARPKDTGKLGWTELPMSQNGSRWIPTTVLSDSPMFHRQTTAPHLLNLFVHLLVTQKFNCLHVINPRFRCTLFHRIGIKFVADVRGWLYKIITILCLYVLYRGGATLWWRNRGSVTLGGCS